ncbi:hypothetical protein FA95DRAFT_780269 [Auriscalpium vulgare]|uniref:Uncharacterized protein n=1 Tax=Auriscalpium vulgare TaxID=40419 RepID=A0ACB8RBL8_9AGAM|nr:hypothetical protein FA95DRAFT_780269 [Auriscalpium vulgare]
MLRSSLGIAILALTHLTISPRRKASSLQPTDSHGMIKNWDGPRVSGERLNIDSPLTSEAPHPSLSPSPSTLPSPCAVGDTVMPWLGAHTRRCVT